MTPSAAEQTMKLIVTVMPKNGVLDPQGKAIGHALGTLGFEGVGEVRRVLRAEGRPLPRRGVRE